MDSNDGLIRVLVTRFVRWHEVSPFMGEDGGEDEPEVSRGTQRQRIRDTAPETTLSPVHKVPWANGWSAVFGMAGIAKKPVGPYLYIVSHDPRITGCGM